jgi:hypothetical protein
MGSLPTPKPLYPLSFDQHFLIARIGWGTDGRQLSERRAIVGVCRRPNGELVGHVLVFLEIDRLTDPNVGMKEFGMLGHGEHPQKRSPGMANQVNFRGLKADSENLDRV